MWSVFLFLCIGTQFLFAFQTSGILGFIYPFPRFCLCRCGVSRVYAGSWRTGRVMGGETVTPHEFPWLAAVNIGTQVVVVGSLISDRHVLTAASSLVGVSASNVTVTLGAHDRCTGSALNISVASITLHPGFSSVYMDNNIALIRLRHSIAFNDYITPICMPFFGVGSYERVAWIPTWSRNNSVCLPRVVTLPTLSDISCLKSAADSKLLTPDKGCLGVMDAKSVICKDEVGAPVMTRWSPASPYRLHGVISTSICNDTAAALYTRTDHHAAWINDHIRYDCQCL